MRKLAILVVACAMAVPAFATKRVTVDKLEGTLNSLRGKSDAGVAKKLSDLELTQKLSDTRLARLAVNLPGTQSQQMLVALADASAFLDLPAAEIPASPAPSQTEQDAMLATVFNYARQTIPKLPNFFATRETARFENTPSQAHQSPTEFSVPVPLHFVGASTDTVLYRNGNEVVDAGAEQGRKYDSLVYALSTSGAFGPILPTVLADIGQGKLTWGHWEQAPEGRRAVYRFAVPEHASHYTVDFSGLGGANQRVPAYHGEMEIDPANGAVLRLSMIAELQPSDPVAEAAIMVQYGPVEIGGKTYICPVKSVARSLVKTVRNNPAQQQDKPHYVWDGDSSTGMRETVSHDDDDRSKSSLQLRVNDVLFTHYHLFRAETRILNADEAVP